MGGNHIWRFRKTSNWQSPSNVDFCVYNVDIYICCIPDTHTHTHTHHLRFPACFLLTEIEANEPILVKLDMKTSYTLRRVLMASCDRGDWGDIHLAPRDTKNILLKIDQEDLIYPESKSKLASTKIPLAVEPELLRGKLLIKNPFYLDAPFLLIKSRWKLVGELQLNEC